LADEERYQALRRREPPAAKAFASATRAGFPHCAEPGSPRPTSRPRMTGFLRHQEPRAAVLGPARSYPGSHGRT